MLQQAQNDLPGMKRFNFLGIQSLAQKLPVSALFARFG